MRNTFYGSPFMNLHSGRDMTDRTNTKRLRKSLHNFKYSEGIINSYSSQMEGDYLNNLKIMRYKWLGFYCLQLEHQYVYLFDVVRLGNLLEIFIVHPDLFILRGYLLQHLHFYLIKWLWIYRITMTCSIGHQISSTSLRICNKP